MDINDIEVIKPIIEVVAATGAVGLLKDPISALVSEPAKAISTGISDIFDLVFTPVQMAKIYRDNKIHKFKSKINSEMGKVTPEKRVDPPINVAGPIIEAAKFFIQDDDICELFAKLIASSINSDLTDICHPAYVEVIKQIKPFEAKIFKSLYHNRGDCGVVELRLKHSEDEGSTPFVKYFYPFNGITLKNYKSFDAAIDNLIRLRLLEILDTVRYTETEIMYEPLKKHTFYKQIIDNLPENYTLLFEEKVWNVTSFGINFAKLCLC